uniref:Gustatory receptor n=1 Tax=Panagrolaimus sp. JU765 TaxID=591449 RepID=A0AC34RBQ9_9BILA
MYDYEVTDLLTYSNITANQTAQFRKSMFGKQQLFFLDCIIIFIGAYLVANALALYYLANQAICREYEKFNQQLKDHIADGSILQLHVMKTYESQLINYLSTARFITNTASFLMDVTFMAGLFIQISSQFALKGYG